MIRWPNKGSMCCNIACGSFHSIQERNLTFLYWPYIAMVSVETVLECVGWKNQCYIVQDYICCRTCFKSRLLITIFHPIGQIYRHRLVSNGLNKPSLGTGFFWQKPMKTCVLWGSYCCAMHDEYLPISAHRGTVHTRLREHGHYWFR